MPGISGIGTESMINRMTQRTQNKDQFSILLSTKTLQVQQEQTQQVTQVLNTVAPMRIGQVSLQV